MFFADGDPTTPDPDYQVWALSIDDPNDTNHNGIPDFSDDVGGGLVQQPRLTLSQTNAALLLSVSGNVGQTYQVQQVSSLTQTNWTLVQSLSLTNNPQSIALARPTNGPSFWRVRSP
jgi:hypothetical protein